LNFLVFFIGQHSWGAYGFGNQVNFGALLQ
jgi:hypothetical protein